MHKELFLTNVWVSWKTIVAHILSDFFMFAVYFTICDSQLTFAVILFDQRTVPVNILCDLGLLMHKQLMQSLAVYLELPADEQKLKRANSLSMLRTVKRNSARERQIFEHLYEYELRRELKKFHTHRNWRIDTLEGIHLGHCLSNGPTGTIANFFYENGPLFLEISNRCCLLLTYYFTLFGTETEA
ncbi:maker479 [Drosophila busckii]|uniref:Maker479 n=1 Tax=Drosophila busckii TaxID=30019 RepID=A0A0M4EAI1_DROBS|nr:maker479 [Drosophila busckii]